MIFNTGAAWLFLLLIPLIIVCWRRYVTGARFIKILAGNWRESQLLDLFVIKWFFSSFFLILFCIFTILAIIGYKGGSYPESSDKKGIHLSFAIDISRSMLSNDLQPSRLEKSKEFIRGIVKNNPGAKFSLTVFKGDAITLVPITEDMDALLSVLNSLSPNLITAKGSNIEKGIKSAFRSMTFAKEAESFLFVITDGESISGDSMKIISEKESYINMYIIGTGTENGGQIPLSDGSYVLDDEGKPHLSKLNYELLSELSQKSNTNLFLLSEFRTLNDILGIINKSISDNKSNKLRFYEKEHYRLFLSLAIVFLIFYFLVRVVKWKNIF